MLEMPLSLMSTSNTFLSRLSSTIFFKDLDIFLKPQPHVKQKIWRTFFRWSRVTTRAAGDSGSTDGNWQHKNAPTLRKILLVYLKGVPSLTLTPYRKLVWKPHFLNRIIPDLWRSAAKAPPLSLTVMFSVSTPHNSTMYVLFTKNKLLALRLSRFPT